MSVQQNIDVIAIMNSKGNIKPFKMKIDDRVYHIIKLKRIVKGITSTCGTFGWLYDVLCDDQKWHRIFYIPDQRIWFVESDHQHVEPFHQYEKDQCISDELYLLDIDYDTNY